MRPGMGFRTSLAKCCCVLVGMLGGLSVVGGCSPTDETAQASDQEPHDEAPAVLRSAFTTAEARDSHEKMVETLARLHRQFGAANPYYGEAAIRRYKGIIDSLDRNKEPRRFFENLLRLGQANVEYGNLSAGIEQLTYAYRTLKHNEAPPQIMVQVTFNLGLAYLRLGETENCCALYAPESCILPLRGAALHTRRTGSESAIRYLTETMNLAKGHESLGLLAQWLLNIAHMTLGDYPENTPDAVRLPEATFESSITFPRFKNIAEGLGLSTDSLAGGVVADDFDGDGDFDLMVSSWESDVSMRYFENRGEEGFTDRTEAAGLSGITGGLNLVHADYDNDGDPDVLVLRGAWLTRNGDLPNSLLRNEGDGRFLDVSFASGVASGSSYPTQTAAWTDYDNDGDLDLFVGNEKWGDDPVPNELFRNEGDGTFTEVGEEAGIAGQADGITKAVVCGDLDNDRWPDVVMSVLDGPNRLYHNNGDGTFTDRAHEAGIDLPRRSFPAWIWDYDNDGNLDVFISSYGAEPQDYVRRAQGKPYPAEVSGLYRGDGTGNFENLAREQGLDMPHLSMGVNVGDLNNDGYLDFYLGTGAPELFFLMPNRLYLNRRGDEFTDVTMASGLGHLQKGHAIAFVDFDGDGDQDIFEQMGGAKRVDSFRDALYENPGFGNHWIGLKLTGTRSNRSAIGARIRVDFVEDGKARSVYRHVDSGGSFGANPFQQHVGIGSANEVTLVEVFWPASGIKQEFRDLPVDTVVHITEGSEEFAPVGPGSVQ